MAVMEPSVYSAKEKNTQWANDGTAEVREGQVYITNPGSGGKEAKIIPGMGLKLFVNSTEIHLETAVSMECKIDVEIQDKSPERNIDVVIDDDCMAAYIKIAYNNGGKFKLKDKAPSNTILVELESDRILECTRYTMDEVVSFLRNKGITYGIDKESIARVIESGCREPSVAARGLIPVDGTDDMIVSKYVSGKERKFEEVNDRVDFYSIGKITSVEIGDIVAEKVIGTEGTPGIDISGREVKPKKGKRAKLLAGKGVKLSDDGLKVYSQVVGRPEVRDNSVSVYEVYKVLDVDTSIGNIEFAGDVVVNRNILEGRKVKAGGNVTVYGSITDGEITSGGNVTVNQNIISSRIKSGCTDVARLKIIAYLESFKKGFLEIFTAVRVLKETGKVPITYKDGQIIKLLFDTKFKGVFKDVNDFRSTVLEIRDSVGGELLTLTAKIVKYFSGNGPLLIENAQELMGFGDLCEIQTVALKEQLKEPSRVEANYIQNSTIETSGSIYIYGKGCYNSNLYCSREVSFERPGSVMRGGEIAAGGNVKIYELGSPGGAMTLVSTSKDYEITCDTAYTNSIIKIGNMSNRLDAPVKKLKAYLYKGELMVEKSKL